MARKITITLLAVLLVSAACGQNSTVSTTTTQNISTTTTIVSATPTMTETTSATVSLQDRCEQSRDVFQAEIRRRNPDSNIRITDIYAILPPGLNREAKEFICLADLLNSQQLERSNSTYFCKNSYEMGMGSTPEICLGLLRAKSITTPPTADPDVTNMTGVDPTTPESTLTVPAVPPATTTELEVIVPPTYTPYTDEDYGSTPCPADDADRVLDFSDSFQNCLQSGVEYTAAFTTTAGEFKVRLDSVNTPGTTNNFISLARHKYYDGTLLHRTDPSIGIIQGGSPHNNSANDRGPGYNIKDEGTGFNYPRGLLVMARGGAPNSASAQFFFSVNENTRVLNSQGTYVVFGEVIEGIDVLQSILNSHQDIPNSVLGGAPNPPVTVQLVEIQEGEPTTQAATLTAP